MKTTYKITILLLLFILKSNAQISTNNTNNSGTNSSAIGESTTASGDKAVAMGGYTDATGNFSTAMGRDTEANGDSSTAIGEWAVANGHRSTAIGYRVTASDYASLAIGSWNSSGSSVTSDALAYNSDNTAFVIGNGTGSASKSDAFKVLFNGNTTIGGDNLTIGDLSAFGGIFTQRSAIDVVAHSDGDLMTGYINGSTGDRFNIKLDASNSNAKISSGGGYNLTFSTEGGTMNFESSSFGATYAFDGDATISNDLTVSGDVVVSSDARLKANIISLGSTLARLLLIDGKSYTMIKDGKQKIGVLAQDIQKVFPELVTTDNNKMLAVNYQGLVPVLINALKEQQVEIDKLKEQEQRLERLEKLIYQLKK